jgi:hypothetical protein
MNQLRSGQEFFSGLKALAESAFPKRCTSCGKTFETAEQFIEETRTIRPDITGLKQSWDDDDVTIVEVYRNCTCGSTLMDFFSDRRDVSDVGAHRRVLFDQLLPALEGKGLSRFESRHYLLRVLRGQMTEADRELMGAAGDILPFMERKTAPGPAGA